MLTLSSPAFAPGARIPVDYTCEGENASPPLTWSDVVPGTASLALICADPDAPNGTWYHWAIFDMPPEQRELAAAVPESERVGAIRQAISDFRRPGYGGPCPPRGHGVHHYHFRLLALDVASLPLPPRCDCRAVEAAATPHILSEATLIGVYSRS